MKLAAALLLVLATPAFAQQVGYPPDHSPYQDLEWSQHLTVYGGYFRAHKDNVGAAPGSAPMLGVRYEIDIAGPAQYFVRVARTSSERNSFNPLLPQATRLVGKVSDPLYLAETGISFNLTGRKSWHSLVPVVGFALGIASATKQAPKDPYNFGTQFAFSTEVGVRVIPSRRYELRFMLDNTFYQNRYPGGYFLKTVDPTAILGTDVARSSYMANFAFTAGLSVPLFR